MSGEVFSGSIGFTDRRSSQNNGMLWLGTITSSTSTPPEVLVVRLLPNPAGSPPPKKNAPVKDDGPTTSALIRQGSLTVTELDLTTGKRLTANPSKVGEVTLTLAGKPSGTFTWCVFIETAPVKNMQLALRVRAVGDTTPPIELALTPLGTLQPVQLNSATPQVVRALLRPVPRLAQGINNVPTPKIAEGYRNFDSGGGAAANFNGSNASDLQALIYRIFCLLDQPTTLDPVWDSEAGDSSAQLRSNASSSPSIPEAEELWARQVSEMLLAVPYDSPMNPANSGRGKNSKIPALVDLPFCGGSVTAKHPNPAYGIPFACQHLATFGIVSRGEVKAAALGAGSMTATTVVNTMIGQWFVDENSPTEVKPAEMVDMDLDPKVLKPGALLVDLAKIIAQVPAYAPGACHLFSNAKIDPTSSVADDAYDSLKKAADAARDPKNPGKLLSSLGTETEHKVSTSTDPADVDRKKARLRISNTISVNGTDVKEGLPIKMFPVGVDFERDQMGAAHIGFTLRVRNGKAQFFDTGGLNAVDSAGNTRGTGITLFQSATGVLHNGTMDDPLALNCHSIASPFRGVGVFGKLKTDADAQQLADHVNTVLKNARPIGLARLYLLTKGSLATVTPKLPLRNVIFASKIKLMYDDAGVGNYSIARYLWSLRDFPATQVEAVWVIYVPLFPLAKTILEGKRSDTLTDHLLNAGLQASDLPAKTKVVRGCQTSTGGSVLAVSPDQLDKLTRLEGRGSNSTAPVPLDLIFKGPLTSLPSALPNYFK